MTKEESLYIIKQRINTIRLNTKIGSRTIADEENAILLNHIEYHLNKLGELVERDTPMKVIKTPHERLFDLGFEKVAKHKYVKVNKGGSGYNTPYKITIEFAFNMYQVKCECENWIGVDLELAEVLVDYLKE